MGRESSNPNPFHDDDWRHALFTLVVCGTITHLVLVSPDTFPAIVRPVLIFAGAFGSFFAAVSFGATGWSEPQKTRTCCARDLVAPRQRPEKTLVHSSLTYDLSPRRASFFTFASQGKGSEYAWGLLSSW